MPRGKRNGTGTQSPSNETAATVDPKRTAIGQLQRMVKASAPGIEVSKIVALPFDQGYEFYVRANGDVARIENLFHVAAFLAAHPDSTGDTGIPRQRTTQQALPMGSPDVIMDVASGSDQEVTTNS